SCYATKTITVNLSPSPISGDSVACIGAPLALSSSTSGGVWSSSVTFYATIGSSTGIVTGINYGTTVITYAFTTGCRITKTVIVRPLPDRISGVTYLTAGSTTTFANLTSGGVWSSSNSAVATIGSGTGSVTGTG